MTSLEQSNSDNSEKARVLQHTDADMPDDDGDLTDMLGEMRVLLATAQLLSAFLITLPFYIRLRGHRTSEKRVFVATFVLSVGVHQQQRGHPLGAHRRTLISVQSQHARLGGMARHGLGNELLR